jgi:hypothetical protein
MTPFLRRRLLASPREILGLDLRSLALLRIGLGATLILDLLYRARYLEEQYSDAGLVPRALLREAIPDRSPLELHALSGAVGYQAFLFGAALVFAAMLLVGCRTRLACVASWVLLVSLHFRNPFVLDGGSHVPRVVLFWCLFLPLGARLSLDARRHPERARGDPLHVSAASLALLVQVAVIYFFAGLAKRGPQWRVYGNALRWVLVDPPFIQPAAHWLEQVPGLLRVLSFAVVYLEIAGPLLLFCPWWNGPVRAAVCAGFLGLQLGIGLTMWVGFFPLANVAAALGLLPGWFWERLPARWRGEGAGSIPGPAPVPPPGAHLLLARARDGLVLMALAWVVMVNLSYRDGRIALPHWFLAPGYPIKLYQLWDMYHSPRHVEQRFDFLGTTRDGSQVSLWDEGPGERWKTVQAIQSDYNFKIGQFMLRGQRVSGDLKVAYARWLCRQWNADAPPERSLVSLELAALVRHLSSEGHHGPWRASRVLSHRCEP